MATADGPERAAKEALAAFGAIDILVNNAGIALIDPLLDAKVADWDQTMAVNLRAPWLLAKALVPGMIKRKRGKIINISSQAGVVGLEAHGAYAASKGGLNMLTKVMCVEWAKHNIQINSVCPTVILTPMGEQVWGKPEKGDPMKAKIPAAPLRQAGGGGGHDPLPRVVGVGPGERPGHPDRRRLHRGLTSI